MSILAMPCIIAQNTP